MPTLALGTISNQSITTVLKLVLELSNLLIPSIGIYLSHSSFGKDSRREMASNVPGPGSYDDREHYIKQVANNVMKKNPSYSLLGRK